MRMFDHMWCAGWSRHWSRETPIGGYRRSRSLPPQTHTLRKTVRNVFSKSQWYARYKISKGKKVLEGCNREDFWTRDESISKLFPLKSSISQMVGNMLQRQAIQMPSREAKKVVRKPQTKSSFANASSIHLPSRLWTKTLCKDPMESRALYKYFSSNFWTKWKSTWSINNNNCAAVRCLLQSPTAVMAT